MKRGSRRGKERIARTTFYTRPTMFRPRRMVKVSRRVLIAIGRMQKWTRWTTEGDGMGRSGRTAHAFVAALVMIAPLGAVQPKPEMQRVPQFDNDRAVSWLSVIPPHAES